MGKQNKSWVKSNIETYNMLKSYMTKKYNDIGDDFIIKYQRTLDKIVMDHSRWGNSSKSKIFYMISKYLQLHGENQRYMDHYKELGWKYREMVTEHEKNNTQSESEIKYYRDHEYLVKLLDAIDFQNIPTVKQHYEYLLLAMLILQPPVRTSFYSTAKFIRKKVDNDKNNNFIKINSRGTGDPVIQYIVNSDKVTDTKIYNMNKDLSIIPVEDKRLINIIYTSYKALPRTYLFEIIEKKKPLSNQQLTNYLRDITKSEGITFNMMRSSYVNYFYSKVVTTKDKEKLAHKMRHSINAASTNYFKVAPIQTSPIIQTQPTIQTPIQSQVVQLVEGSNCDPLVGSPLYLKRRRDVIYQLNKNGREVRQSSLDKYKIVFDKTDKKYK